MISGNDDIVLGNTLDALKGYKVFRKQLKSELGSFYNTTDDVKWGITKRGCKWPLKVMLTHHHPYKYAGVYITDEELLHVTGPLQLKISFQDTNRERKMYKLELNALVELYFQKIMGFIAEWGYDTDLRNYSVKARLKSGEQYMI